ARLTLNLQNTSVENILDEIEQQSEFFFVFNYKLVDVDRPVDIQANNKPISEVLASVFSGSDVDYVVLDRQILLSPKSYLKKVKSTKQPISVTGTITDEDGNPIPGVSIIIKGTTQGSISDANGEYSINVDDPDATLEFSFIGMLTQEVPVGNQTEINITLARDAIGLEEVIAIGYGTIRKSDLTSAIARVNGEDISKRVTSRLDEALQGHISGVNVTQASGVPGNAPVIRIRGVGSITSGNQPLFIVDGFPIESNTVIGNLNMNDVESVEVLKDAASASIYGSRGSNGVVLITTKKGEPGKAQISFNSYYGIQSTEKRIEFLDGNELGQMMTELRNQLWVQEGGSINDPNDVRPASRRIDPLWTSGNQPTYDAQDYVFRTAPVQNYSVTAKGGHNMTNYYISADYLDQEGIVKGTGFKKYSLRTNLETSVSDRIKIGLMLSPSFSEQIDRDTEGKDRNLNRIMWHSPLTPLEYRYNFDNNTIINDYGDEYNGISKFMGSNFYNFDRVPDLRRRTQIISNGFVDVKLMEDLHFKTNIGLLYSGLDRQRFFDFEAGRGTIQSDRWNSIGTNWLWENTLNYFKIINKHSFSVLAGYSSQKEYYKSTFMSGRGHANDLSETINNATEIFNWDEGVSEWALISMLGRMTYNFDSRYYLTASIRRDGSSRFGSNNKWSVFPSASAAWRISKENFFQDIEFINNLKLRASWGVTGNNRIGNYSSIARLGGANTPLGISEEPYGGLLPSSPENKDLGWERTTATNIGLDLGIFENRLSITFEAYYNLTKDLLLSVPVPLVTGFNTQLRNIGEVSNKGLEMDLFSRNLVGSFEWNTRFNFSVNKNEVQSLGDNDTPIIMGEWFANVSYTGIGYPIGTFYMHVQDGIFQNQAEVDSSPLWGNEGVGDVKLKDVDGDGDLDSDDRDFVGQPFPKWNAGITNEFRYKNIDLSIFINAAGGHKTYYAGARYYDVAKSDYIMAYSSNWANRWRSEDDPGDGHTPNVASNATTNGGFATTRWLYDSDWWRIKNITLGYTLPKKLSHRLMMESLRVYVAGDNLFLGTKYPGYNPEGVSMRGENVTTSAGYDYSVYPLAKKIVFGLNVTF
ncbi:MAG: TonB-dependent receptor, partial [Bacteroidota bacterium]